MNAKQEFLNITKDFEVLCAIVNLCGNEGETYWAPLNSKPIKDKSLTLPVDYTKEEYQNFLNELEFEYDDSWGHWYINGTIWLKDGRWIERNEYDGSEWWRLVERPNIPEECLPEGVIIVDTEIVPTNLASGYYAGEEFKDKETKQIAIEAWAKGFMYATRQNKIDSIDEERKELLISLMKMDEESGLYNND
jgi:hypothetical protein